jgi:hypothetical protein
MFGSAILEVAIGLAVIYLLLSLICSAAQESLEAWLKKRASNLEKGLRELLHDPDGTGLVSKLYNHPLIYGLFQGSYDPTRTRSKSLTTNLPTYIPSANFATALMDIIVRGSVSPTVAQNAPQPPGELSFDTLRAAVTNSPSLTPAIQRVMHLMLDSANGDLAKAQANLETWFNSGMDRVAGWYKRRTQWILFAIGLFVTVAMNVDTLKVAGELYRTDILRAGVVAQAGAITETSSEGAQNALNKLEELRLPIGWYIQKTAADPPAVLCRSGEIADHFPGWLITALAISLGAPFWFDLLNKLIVIRSTIKPREKNTGEPAKDQQGAAQQASTQPPTGPGVSVAALGKDLFPDENGVDACDIDVEDVTLDEELPVSEGGVA